MIISIIDVLVESGINIEQENDLLAYNRQTPLYYPIASMNEKVWKYLIECGANAKHVDRDSYGILNWFDAHYEKKTKI